MSFQQSEPTSHIFLSQSLKLHYVDWGNENAETIIMVHGGKDHCRMWDWMARILAKDYHVIALDLRGHGNSEHVKGSGYHLPDFVYDLTQLVEQRSKLPVNIIAHSLGGVISMTFAGLFPEKVKNLVVIEGLIFRVKALKAQNKKNTKQQLIDWIQEVKQASSRFHKRYKSIDAACNRMLDVNPKLTNEQGLHLTKHAALQNEDNSFSWKFHQYTKIWPMFAINEEHILPIFKDITCPVLMLHGNESYVDSPKDLDMLKYFNNIDFQCIEEAGHWVHHDQLDAVMQFIHPFLANSSNQTS